MPNNTEEMSWQKSGEKWSESLTEKRMRTRKEVGINKSKNHWWEPWLTGTRTNEAGHKPLRNQAISLSLSFSVSVTNYDETTHLRAVVGLLPRET